MRNNIIYGETTKAHEMFVNPLVQTKFKNHVHNTTNTSLPIRNIAGVWLTTMIRRATIAKTK